MPTPHYPKPFIYLFVLVAILILAAGTGCNPHDYKVEDNKIVLIQEDDPDFNCLTMGNQDCGPIQDCMEQWNANPMGVEVSEAMAECNEG